MAKASEKVSEPKRALVSQTFIPNISLADASRIAQAIWDDFAGKDAAPHQIAIAVDMSPTSGTWRNLCGASIAYGLTEGGYNASTIKLTAIGRAIIAPTDEDADASAKIEAIMKPKLLNDFFQKYDRAKFPRDEIARNVLAEMGLPKDRTEKAVEIIKENGKYAGILQNIKGGLFIALNTPTTSRKNTPSGFDTLGLDTDKLEDPLTDELDTVPKTGDCSPPALPVNSPKQLFVAHGKNHKPLEDLKKVLQQFKIAFKVAIDEPNKGRPISGKVASLMHECSAGIFIFTKDEQFLKKTGEEIKEIWRPSENVVYELGAATILWSQKIIIMKEDGVNFPSDFSDLGYITFKDGELSSKALDILKELVALDLVRVSAA